MARTEPETSEPRKSGKGRPTPTRKEAQARNARPMIGDRSKEARRRERMRMAEARERARIGLAEGDERYLTARDSGPQRRFVRDVVDARTSIGEFLIPVMLVVLVGTFLPNPLPLYSVIAMWVFVLLAVADVFVLIFSLKKRLIAKFGEDRIQPGWRWYAAMRALQFRPLRLPKPQVRRREYPH